MSKIDDLIDELIGWAREAGKAEANGDEDYHYDYDRTVAVRIALEAEIAKMQTAAGGRMKDAQFTCPHCGEELKSRWIPVSERLPEGVTEDQVEVKKWLESG